MNHPHAFQGFPQNLATRDPPRIPRSLLNGHDTLVVLVEGPLLTKTPPNIFSVESQPQPMVGLFKVGTGKPVRSRVIYIYILGCPWKLVTS